MTKKEHDANIVKLREVMRQCEENLTAIKKASEENDMDKMMQAMRRQQHLNEERNEIAAKVGTVVLSDRYVFTQDEIPGSSK